MARLCDTPHLLGSYGLFLWSVSAAVAQYSGSGSDTEQSPFLDLPDLEFSLPPVIYLPVFAVVVAVILCCCIGWIGWIGCCCLHCKRSKRKPVHTDGAFRGIVPEVEVGEGNNKETQTESEERRNGIGRETQVQGEEDTNRSTQPQPPEPARTNSATPTQPLLPTIANCNLPAVNANSQHQETSSLPKSFGHHGKHAVNAPPGTFPIPGTKRSSQVREEDVQEDMERFNKHPEQDSVTKRGSQVKEERDDKVPDDVERINEQCKQSTLTKQGNQVKEERDDEVQEDIDVGRFNEQPEQATVSKHGHQIGEEIDEVPESFKEQPEQIQATSDNQVPEDMKKFNETPEQATVNKQGSQVGEERDERVQDDLKRFSQQLELPTLTPLDETPSTAPVQSATPVQLPSITSTNQETGSPRSSIAQGEIFESLQRVRIRHDSVQESKKATPKETAV